MDKRWRNLIILVILVALVLAVIFWNMNSPILVQKKSLDTGLSEVRQVFTKNAINFDDFTSMKFVSFNETKAQAESKRVSLNTIAKDLNKFKLTFSSYAESDKKTLGELSDLLYETDTYYLSQLDLSESMSSVSVDASDMNAYCDSLPELLVLNEKVTTNFIDLVNLYQGNMLFSLDNNYYDTVLNIDLNSETDAYNESQIVLGSAKNYCWGEEA